VPGLRRQFPRPRCPAHLHHDQLLPLVYDGLRRLAALKLAPRHVEKTIHAELETIVLKAVEKNAVTFPRPEQED
jgi:hypothetical protein